MEQRQLLTAGILPTVESLNLSQTSIIENGVVTLSGTVSGAGTTVGTTPIRMLSGVHGRPALAFDQAGNFYAANFGPDGDTISKFAPGSTVPDVILTGIRAPTGMAVDAGGSLYVANYGSDSVSVFAPGSTTPTSTLTGLNDPFALAFDGAGNLYVANAGNYLYQLTGGTTISKFAPGSTTPTTTLTGANIPIALAIDDAGSVYAANYGTNTVTVYAGGSTTPTATLTGLNAPYSLALDSSNTLYVANYEGSTISKFVSGSTTPSATLTGVDHPYAVVCDVDDAIYVANTGALTVSRFESGSTTPDASLTGVSNPYTLAFDPNGSLFVGNYNPFSVSVFAPGAGRTADTQVANINWRDGSAIQSVPVDPVTHVFSATHRYLDDDPSGTSSDIYSISVSATNSSGGISPSVSAPLTVNNAAPNVDPISGPTQGIRGQSVWFSSGSYDIGTRDTHTTSWQIINSSNNVVATGSGNGLIFTPAVTGVYDIRFQVTDDDGGSTVRTTTMTVTSTAVQPDDCHPNQTRLVVGGTQQDDTIVVSPVGNNGTVDVTINGVSQGTYSPTGRIVVYGYAGNDDVQIAGSVSAPAWLYGGAGDDRLKGGNGHDVLLGEAGEDLLVGGQGRDFLIGGVGADRIVGNADEDILIAGTTDFDLNTIALCAIMEKWTSNLAYNVRVAQLSTYDPNDLDGYWLMNEGNRITVHDDNAADVLTGSADQDWFFANLFLSGDDATRKDRITDLNAGEFAADIDFITS